MNITEARERSAAAHGAREAAHSALAKLYHQRAQLERELLKEQNELAALGAEAVAARAASKLVNSQALGAASAAVSVTERAIEVINGQIKAATVTCEDRASVAEACKRRVELFEGGALLFAVAPIVSEILDRLREADPRVDLKLVNRLKRIVDMHPSHNEASWVRRSLASEAVSLMYGTDSDARVAAHHSIETQVLDAELARLLPRAGDEAADSKGSSAPTLRRVV